MKLTDRLALRLGRQLPVVLQTETSECAIACLAMVAGYHGHHADLRHLRLDLGVSPKGASLRQLMDHGQRLKLNARAMRLELEELSHLRTPCVLHWDFNHFVVLKSVEADALVLHDPAWGLRRVDMAEASRRFTGVAVEFWPDQGFETRKAPPKVAISAMVGQISGLYRSLLQILSLALVLEVFALVSPLFLQWTIDQVIVSEDRQLLTTLALGFGALLLMQQATSAVRAWVLLHMGTQVAVQWKANIFTHLLKLPSDYFARRNLGDVASRFGSLDAIQQTLTSAFIAAVLDGLMSVATLGLMLLYSPMLAAVAIGAMVLYAIGRWIWYRPLKDASEQQIVHAARQQSHMLETIRGIGPLKLFQREPERRSAWLALLVEQINAGIRTQKLQLVYQQINGLLFGIEHVLVIWLGASLVMDSQFTVGALMAFTAYKMQFDNRVGSLVDRYFEIRMLHLHAERLADIALHPVEAEPAQPRQVRPERKDLHVCMEQVRFRYSPQEPWILDGIDLRIEAGQSVVFIGPSGCGKSTLFNLLLSLLKLEEGRILLGGIDTLQMGPGAVRGLIGTVSQDDMLFAGSIADNICMFDPQPDMDWLMECARIAAVHDDIAAMPMGYHALIGELGSALSGGQKQRVLLARALYKKPAILLLDEATSHLDTRNEHRVNLAIRALNITRLMIAHRPETIATADRVIMLRAGRIAIDESAQNYVERRQAKHLQESV